MNKLVRLLEKNFYRNLTTKVKYEDQLYKNKNV